MMELEAEVMQLKEQLGKAKSVNDAMWDSVVHRLVNSGGGDEISEVEKEGSDDLGRRKRSRGC